MKKNDGLFAALFYPLLAEQAALIILVTVHSMVISKADNTFLNALSLVDQINIFVSSVFICVAAGCAILTAQAFGSERRGEVSVLYRSSTFMGTVSALILCAVFIIGNRAILSAIYPSASPELMACSAEYMVFVALSFPLYFLFTNYTGILRACMDGRASFYTAAVSGISNLAITVLLVIVFRMGIRGVGIGLLLSRAVSCLFAHIILRRRGFISEKTKWFDKKTAFQILKLGLFIGAESVIFQLGKLMLQRFIAAAGDVQITANAVAMSVMGILAIPGSAMCMTAQNLCGRYAGLGEPEKARTFIKKSVLMSSAVLGALSIASLPFMRAIIGLYTDDAAAVSETYKLMLVCAAALPLFWSIGNIVPAGLRGLGRVRLPAAVISISMWVYRVPMSYLLCVKQGWGAMGVFGVMCVEWGLYGAVFIISDLIVKKRRASRALKKESDSYAV